MRRAWPRRAGTTAPIPPRCASSGARRRRCSRAPGAARRAVRGAGGGDRRGAARVGLRGGGRALARSEPRGGWSDRGQRHGARRRLRGPRGGARGRRADGGGAGRRRRRALPGEQALAAPRDRRAGRRASPRCRPGFTRGAGRFPRATGSSPASPAVTVVVEAAERSGALITARVARDLGRDVAAVPGRITSPLAAGANALLRDGAHVVDGPQAVLDVLFGVGVRRAEPVRDGRDLAPRLREVLAAVREGRDTVGGAGRRGREHDGRRGRAGRARARGLRPAGRGRRVRAAVLI